MAETSLRSLSDLRGLRDVPLFKSLTMFIGVALAVAAGAALFNWSRQPDYITAFPGLSAKDAGEVAETLRAAKIPVRVDTDSGEVMVPSDKLAEARLRASSAGLPKDAPMGFEMIQGDQGFGTSQFIENARYQLALETELARTVSGLQPVKNARVHLALPKPSAFTQSHINASASVLVELRPGRQLEAQQVSSIEHLVASSVPDLAPESVTVIDQYGRLLSSTSGDGVLGQSSMQYQYARRAESDYVRRIEELLAPMLGSEHIAAQVSADYDFAVTEEAHESYRPDGSVVRSEQINEDTTRSPANSGSSNSPSGIPGALSNQPPPTVSQTPPPPPAPTPPAATPAAGAKPGTAAAAPAAAPAPAPAVDPMTTQQTKSETRNYELDRTVSHTQQPVGRVRRLSVAVLVDNVAQPDGKGGTTPTPLSTEQMAKVEALVKQAVGFDESRGDKLTVQNAPFLTTAVEAPETVPIWKRPEIRGYVREGLGALMVLVLIMAVLRPLMRTLMVGPAEVAKAPAQLNGGASEQQMRAQVNNPALAEDRLALSSSLPPPPPEVPGEYEQRLSMARSAVTQDPKRVAQVVKTWLSEDG